MSVIMRTSIVFYLFSTSNHNCLRLTILDARIVFYLFSTSNHNKYDSLLLHSQLSFIFFLHQTTTKTLTSRRTRRLSFIFFLHQTTTPDVADLMNVGLSFIFFLHQTTTVPLPVSRPTNCLLSFFYIKPQLSTSDASRRAIVFYLFSTSNHNEGSEQTGGNTLSFIFFLHQTTTTW